MQFWPMAMCMQTDHDVPLLIFWIQWLFEWVSCTWICTALHLWQFIESFPPFALHGSFLLQQTCPCWVIFQRRGYNCENCLWNRFQIVGFFRSDESMQLTLELLSREEIAVMWLKTWCIVEDVVVKVEMRLKIHWIAGTEVAPNNGHLCLARILCN